MTGKNNNRNLLIKEIKFVFYDLLSNPYETISV